MTKFHIRPGGDIGQCGASEGNCPFGGADSHFDNSIDARAAAEEKMKWQYDKTLGKKRYPAQRGKFGRTKRPNDPKVIGDDYIPLKNPVREEEDKEKRYVEDNENPNMRHLDNPDHRYLGAQERSIRQSSLTEEDTEIALENYRNEYSGLIEYDVQDAEGSTIKYCFNKEGKLHNLIGFAYEDDNSKVRYYKGIVHADEETEGPAVVMKNNGGEMFIKYGLLHRQNGPAVITSHEVEYWRHGLLHRTGGPAILRSNGEEEYWDKGVHIRTVVPESPKPPESFTRETKAWWSDSKAVEEAEYQKDNYI